jgi:hypothetical protein
MKALDGSFAGARAVVREARASVEGSFAALEAALAIIYPPAERPTAVECRCFTCRAYRSGHGSIAAVFKAHPVITPTGDSGALREALVKCRAHAIGLSNQTGPTLATEAIIAIIDAALAGDRE